ncbi:TPA: hypothetical protein ACH3X2_007548 [Trebouxia sp. C0005]
MQQQEELYQVMLCTGQRLHLAATAQCGEERRGEERRGEERRGEERRGEERRGEERRGEERRGEERSLLRQQPGARQHQTKHPEMKYLAA